MWLYRNVVAFLLLGLQKSHEAAAAAENSAVKEARKAEKVGKAEKMSHSDSMGKAEKEGKADSLGKADAVSQDDHTNDAATDAKTAERTLWQDVRSENRGYFVDSALLAAAAGRAVPGGFVRRLAGAPLSLHALLLRRFPPHAVPSRGDLQRRIRPSLLHATSLRMKACLRAVLFANVSLISLFQLPLFPDGARGGRGLVLALRLFGIAKLETKSIEGMAMCLGDGVDAPPSALVECQKYWEFGGMGLYAVLLAAFFAYVRFGGSFKARKRCWRVRGTESSTSASSAIPRGTSGASTRWSTVWSRGTSSTARVETGKRGNAELQKVEQQLYLLLRKTVRKVEIVESAVYHEGFRGSRGEP